MDHRKPLFRFHTVFFKAVAEGAGGEFEELCGFFLGVAAFFEGLFDEGAFEIGHHGFEVDAFGRQGGGHGGAGRVAFLKIGGQVVEFDAIIAA